MSSFSKLVSLVEGPVEPIEDPVSGPSPGPESTYAVRLPIRGYFEFTVKASSEQEAEAKVDDMIIETNGEFCKLHYRITGDEKATKVSA